jgi:rhodanese-related sulfurtransferase
MQKRLVVLIFISIVGILFAQPSIDATISKLNNNTVDYIMVPQLVKNSNVVLLDTRKKEEFEVSHIENALWVGHKKFQLETVEKDVPDKTTAIVVYCSIGVRSEDIGEKLIKAGYTNVKNLYGGIFEWKNRGQPVFDSMNNETQKVHAFNRFWGKYLNNAEKVYRNKTKAIDN